MAEELQSKIVIFEYSGYILFAAILIIWICYILSKKIICWGIDKGLELLLSYIVGGLLFLNIFLLFFIMNEITKAKEILTYFLQIIALFGVLLLLGSLMKYVFNKITEKKA